MIIVTQKEIISYMYSIKCNNFFKGIDELHYQLEYDRFMRYTRKSLKNMKNVSIYERCLYASPSKRKTNNKIYAIEISGRVDCIELFYTENNERKHLKIIMGFVKKKTSKYY